MWFIIFLFLKINGSFRRRKEETVVITNPHRAQLTPLYGVRPELGALPSMELSSSQSRIWQPSELSTGSQRLEAGPVSGWSRRRQAGGRPARLHSHLDHRSDTGASTALRGAARRHLGPRQPARKRTTVSGMRRWSSRARCVPDTHHHPVDCMVVRLYTAVTHYLLLLAEGQIFFSFFALSLLPGTASC